MKGYFTKEVKRLQKQKPVIEKTAHLNKQHETQTLSNINWEQELSSFIESDINKPAFKGFYTQTNENGEDIYRATQAKLKTQELKILRRKNGSIERISISNHNENALYTSDEYLEYCPDSVYQIVKRQEVRISGTNNYWIFGRFKK